jgi:hypothetical protein
LYEVALRKLRETALCACSGQMLKETAFLKDDVLRMSRKIASDAFFKFAKFSMRLGYAGCVKWLQVQIRFLILVVL